MKPIAPHEFESMHEVAPWVARWRRALGWALPRAWRHPALLPVAGPRGRRLSTARMELDPASPAKSWADWEVSRRGRPAG